MYALEPDEGDAVKLERQFLGLLEAGDQAFVSTGFFGLGKTLVSQQSRFWELAFMFIITFDIRDSEDPISHTIIIILSC